MGSYITEKTFVFTFSLLAVVFLWWVLYKGKRKASVILFGKNDNPYVKNLIIGMSKQSEEQNITIDIVLFEDIEENTEAYHSAIRTSEAEVIVCRIYSKETVDIIAGLGKKCIVVSWNDQAQSAYLNNNAIVNIIKTPPQVFEDDALVVVPTPDYPEITTQGGIVAATSADEHEIETITNLAKMYDLKSLYLISEIPGFSDSTVQMALLSVFKKIRTVPSLGLDEGRAAIKSLVAVSGNLPSFSLFQGL